MFATWRKWKLVLHELHIDKLSVFFIHAVWCFRPQLPWLHMDTLEKPQRIVCLHVLTRAKLIDYNGSVVTFICYEL